MARNLFHSIVYGTSVQLRHFFPKSSYFKIKIKKEIPKDLCKHSASLTAWLHFFLAFPASDLKQTCFKPESCSPRGCPGGSADNITEHVLFLACISPFKNDQEPVQSLLHMTFCIALSQKKQNSKQSNLRTRTKLVSNKYYDEVVREVDHSFMNNLKYYSTQNVTMPCC